MLVSKFGGSLKYTNDNTRLVESVRGYVRNSAICLNPDHYDAKKRKIVHIARPAYDTDATNKGYVDESFSTIRNDVREVREGLSQLSTNMNRLLQDKVEILSRNVESLRSSQRKNEAVSTDLRHENERLAERTDELSSASVRIVSSFEDLKRFSSKVESSLEDLKRFVNESTVSTETLRKTTDSINVGTRRLLNERTYSKAAILSSLDRQQQKIYEKIDERVKKVNEAIATLDTKIENRERESFGKVEKALADMNENNEKTAKILINERVKQVNEAIAALEEKVEKRAKESFAKVEKAIADLNRKIEETARRLGNLISENNLILP